MTTLSIKGAAPFEVAYISDGEKTYAKLATDDLERLLEERRGAMFMAKFWMVLGLVAAITAAGTAYWFVEHPVTNVLMVAPADVK